MRDYTEFFDIRTLEIFQMTQVYMDFTQRFQKFLMRFIGTDMSEERAGTIGRTLVASMSDSNLHYHTPVHILSMFQFAEKNELEISAVNELAIWFHDAVYIPGSIGCNEVNERCSGHFMKALMDPFLNESISQKACSAICATANHLDVEVSPEHILLLDLDLCGFALNQEAINNCIRRENPELEDDQFNERRRTFLQALLSRGFVYRSVVFQDRFEKLALENIYAQL